MHGKQTSKLAGTLCCYYGMQFHFVVLERKDGIHVVDFLENEPQVFDLPAVSEIFRALEIGARHRRNPSPALDNCQGPWILGLVTCLHQTFGNLGAAHLVLFPEFLTAASADHGYSSVPARH
jgi:hypothetical protein